MTQENVQDVRSGEIEIRSGHWRWYDMPMAAEDGDGSVVLRTVLYLGAEEGDIMRRFLPGEAQEVTQERARELASCTDEREFFVPGGQCIAREDPVSRPGARRLSMRLPGGQSVVVDSPGNRCLGDLTHDELCDAMEEGLDDGVAEEAALEAGEA